jgi:hypothetical protein
MAFEAIAYANSATRAWHGRPMVCALAYAGWMRP